MRKLSDEQLFARYRKHSDPDAFELLLRRTAPVVTRMARRQRVPEAELDDLVQDVFLGVVLGIDQFDDGGSFTSWVRGIASNKILTLRRRSAQRRIPDCTLERHPPRTDVPELAEARRVVRAAVAALPDLYRQVIELRYFDHLTTEVIARRLRARPSTVRTRISRGLTLLRERLPAGWSSAVVCLPLMDRSLRRAAVPGPPPERAVATPVGAQLGWMATGLLAALGVTWASIARQDTTELATAPRQEVLGLRSVRGRHGMNPPRPERSRQPFGPVEESIALEPEAEPATDASPRFDLRVTLVDGLTGEPVPGLAFGLQRLSDEVGLPFGGQEGFTPALTDDAGLVEFHDVEAGLVRFRFSATVGSAIYRVDADLDLEVEVFEVTRLQGAVVGPTGAPVADAEVWCAESVVGSFVMPFVVARTDREGTFGVSFAGGAPKAVWARTEDGCSEAIETLRGPERQRRVSLTLVPAIGAVAGYVTTSGGVPAANARLILHLAGGWPSTSPVHLARTRADGSFSIEGLPSHDYSLSAIDRRGVPATALVSVSGHSRAPLHLRLPPDQYVEGRVSDSGGGPEVGLLVTLSPRLGRWTHWMLSKQTTSDAEGHFRLGPVLPGRNLCQVVDPETGSVLAETVLELTDRATASWTPSVDRSRAVRQRSQYRHLLTWRNETSLRHVPFSDQLPLESLDGIQR